MLWSESAAAEFVLDLVRLAVIITPLWMVLRPEPAPLRRVAVVAAVQLGAGMAVLAPLSEPWPAAAAQIAGFFVTGFAIGYLRAPAPEPEPEPASVAEPT
ncbi:hypothetical protein Val02_20110 [Virgisporangium aliadipatigenens]|uniref:Holin n=2 Tax=Virgisporangium aliadipatigenens TaxID=741659 RepID=A0A8J3YJE7_9ACTN|nr:hypothetical protein Val02_20110 [Virgisporangium aliadipatigenens]